MNRTCHTLSGVAAVGVVVHLIGDRWRTRSPQARAAVTAFYIAVTAVVAWRIYPHMEGHSRERHLQP